MISITNGTITIGNRAYVSRSGNITINNNKVMIDGVDVTEETGLEEQKEIHISIEGTVESVRLEQGSVTVTGDTGDVKTSQGSISVGGDIKGDAKTSQGSIRAMTNYKDYVPKSPYHGTFYIDQVLLPYSGMKIKMIASRWQWRDERNLGINLPDHIDKATIVVEIFHEDSFSDVLELIEEGYCCYALFGKIIKSSNEEMFGIGHQFNFQWIVSDIGENLEDLDEHTRHVDFSDYSGGHDHHKDCIHEIISIE